MKYAYLALAILLEVFGSGFLKASEGFTKILPATITILSYIGSFYLLSLALKSIPLGLAYATWAGVGIILTSLVSVFIFKAKMDMPAIIGIILIVSGVIIINYWSKTASH